MMRECNDSQGDRSPRSGRDPRDPESWPMAKLPPRMIKPARVSTLGLIFDTGASKRGSLIRIFAELSTIELADDPCGPSATLSR
jgi:hypothetical protein